MIKQCLLYFFILGLVFATQSAFAANIDEVALGLLKAKAQRIKVLIEGNKLVLQNSLSCVEKLACDKESGRSCPDVELFELKEVMVFSEDKSTYVDCKGLLEHYFGIVVNKKRAPEFNESTLENFMKSRINMALIRPQVAEGNEVLAMDIEKYPEYTYNPKLESLVPQHSTGYSLPHVDPAPLSKHEVESLTKKIVKLNDYYTSSFISRNWNDVKYRYLKLSYTKKTEDKSWTSTIGVLNDYCNKNLGDYLRSNDWYALNTNSKCNFLDWSASIRLLQQQFAIFIRGEKELFRHESLLRHHKLSTSNPVFYQTSDSNLTWEKVRVALENMQVASNRSAVNHIKFDSTDWTSLGLVYNFETRFGLSGSIVDASKLKFEDELINEAKLNMSSYFGNEELKNMAIQYGGTAVAFALCMYAGKFLKKLSFSKRVLTKAGCFSALGLPLNTYFLVDGLVKKRNKWYRALGAAEYDLKIDDVSQLFEHDNQIYLSAVFIPFIIKFDGRLYKAMTNKKLLKRILNYK